MRTNNAAIDSSSILTLISRIHSEAADFLQAKMKKLGMRNLASSHGNILYRLSLEDKIPMSELARLVNRDKSTVTVLVRKLEKNGLLARETSGEDGRVSYVSLTDKGRDFAKGTGSLSASLMETCYKGFSDAEKETLLSLLLRISDNFFEVLESERASAGENNQK